MLLIKKANQTCRKCIYHFKLAAGLLADCSAILHPDGCGSGQETRGGTREPSEKMESTGERQAQRQKGQGRRRGRKICESFPFTRRLPRVVPANPSSPLPSVNLSPPTPAESGPLCRAVGELTFHRLPSAALIISPAGVTARVLRFERQQEAAGGAAAGGHVTRAGRSYHQRGTLCVGRSLSALNRGQSLI